jgi:hypothetical protein
MVNVGRQCSSEVKALVLHLICCVILGKSLKLSLAWWANLSNGYRPVLVVVGWVGGNRLNLYVELGWCLVCII